MKSIYKEYYKPDEEEMKKLWEDALFVFDASALLRLYGIKKTLQAKFFTTLKKLKAKLWMPYQVGVEFHRNRPSEICRTQSNFNNNFTDLKKTFDNFMLHPFTMEANKSKKLKNAFKTIKEVGQDIQDNMPYLLMSDPIRDRIENLYASKIGDPYTQPELEDIYKEGALRYSKDTPPGYKDIGKDVADKSHTKKYGDYVIWRQMVDKAQSEQKPIIFITQDKKEDWWWKEKIGDHRLGARYELIKEFSDKTGQTFHMYELEIFLRNAAKYIANNPVSEELIKTIKELKNQEESEKLTDSESQSDQLEAGSLVFTGSDVIVSSESQMSDALTAQNDLSSEKGE